jgi:hypothetical protein
MLLLVLNFNYPIHLWDHVLTMPCQYDSNDSKVFIPFSKVNLKIFKHHCIIVQLLTRMLKNPLNR